MVGVLQRCQGTSVTPLLPQGRDLGWLILPRDITEIKVVEPRAGVECVILISGRCALTFLSELSRVPNAQVLGSSASSMDLQSSHSMPGKVLGAVWGGDKASKA